METGGNTDEKVDKKEEKKKELKKRTEDKTNKVKSIPNRAENPEAVKPVSYAMKAGGKADGKVDKKGVKKELEKKDDDIVFETFYHRSGKEFQCIYQSGMRFYHEDWNSKEWQPFPKRWYNEGLLVTNTILKDGSLDETDKAGVSEKGQHLKSQSGSKGHWSSQGSGDDREGFLMHPTRGRIPTYIFYKKHNVHMYFDRDTGSWVRMPIEWELHHDMVKALVDQVDEAIPAWGDRHSILALLRACNYVPEECISIYLQLQKDEWMKGPKTTKESELLREKEEKILDLEKRVRQLCVERKTDLTELDEEIDAQLSATASGGPRAMEVGGRKAGGGAVPGAVKKGESP